VIGAVDEPKPLTRGMIETKIEQSLLRPRRREERVLDAGQGKPAGQIPGHERDGSGGKMREKGAALRFEGYSGSLNLAGSRLRLILDPLDVSRELVRVFNKGRAARRVEQETPLLEAFDRSLDLAFGLTSTPVRAAALYAAVGKPGLRNPGPWPWRDEGSRARRPRPGAPPGCRPRPRLGDLDGGSIVFRRVFGRSFVRDINLLP